MAPTLISLKNTAANGGDANFTDGQGNLTFAGRVVSGLTQTAAVFSAAAAGKDARDIETARGAAQNEVENNCLQHGCPDIGQIFRETVEGTVTEGVKKVKNGINSVVDKVMPNSITAGGSALGGSANVTVNEDGSVDVGAGGALPVTPGSSLMASYSILDGDTAKPSVSTTYSGGFCGVFAIFCVGGSYSIPQKALTIDVGVGTPGLGGGVTVNKEISKK